MRNVIDEGMGRLHTSTTDLKRTRGKELAGPRIANALSKKVFRFYQKNSHFAVRPLVLRVYFGSTFFWVLLSNLLSM